jgi:eukaryotic-like serine/threonine-protein kinase
MAKLLEDRYQTIKELADDLREVRRQIDAARPAAALKATSAPVAPRPAPSVPLLQHEVDTATIPIPGGMTRKDEELKAVPLAKTFDSFDATLRLAAMTDQTEDFREYITQTQKMRAYKGKIESTSPLAVMEAAAPAVQPKSGPPPEAKKKVAPALAPAAASPMPPPMDGGTTNLIAVAAIVVLAIAAVALMIALVVK